MASPLTAWPVRRARAAGAQEEVDRRWLWWIGRFRFVTAELVARLRRLGQTVATAESLTAGMVAAELTSVPGSSAVLRGGLIVYATELKAVLLGVDPAVLDRHGAVSAEVAGAMAGGVAARLGAELVPCGSAGAKAASVR